MRIAFFLMTIGLAAAGQTSGFAAHPVTPASTKAANLRARPAEMPERDRDEMRSDKDKSPKVHKDANHRDERRDVAEDRDHD